MSRHSNLVVRERGSFFHMNAVRSKVFLGAWHCLSGKVFLQELLLWKCSWVRAILLINGFVISSVSIWHHPLTLQNATIYKSVNIPERVKEPSNLYLPNSINIIIFVPVADSSRSVILKKNQLWKRKEAHIWDCTVTLQKSLWVCKSFTASLTAIS